MKLAKGMHISFSYEGKRLSGIVLGAETEKAVIKLDSGYNITVGLHDLKDPEELASKPQAKAAHTKPAADPALPRIALLHTGGTIASRVDYSTGAVIAQYTAEEILDLYPELSRIANVESKLLANMQSEMIRFAHWNIIARAVEEAAKAGFKGAIVTHGTDTLAMTSAALAFALEGLPIPVILVGSQRSSDRPSSDAVTNLLCAASFIAQEHERFRSVGICMHEGISRDDCVIFPALRTRKMHTSRRDAFKAIGDVPYARIAYPSLKVERLQEYPAASSSALAVKPFDEKLRIGILRGHPQMYAEEVRAFEGFDGLVLELLGIGHMPTMKTDSHNAENDAVLEEIKKMAAKIPVVGAPQTIYGRLNLDVYTPGRQLLAAGVLGNGHDTITETAFVKLAWLLSNHKDKETVRRLYGENLRGEVSERSEEDGFRP